jgi:hypothetical protein
MLRTSLTLQCCSLSAFISDLDRKSPARGPVFSFDQALGDNSVGGEAAVAPQATRTLSRPARPAQIPPSTLAAAAHSTAGVEDVKSAQDTTKGNDEYLYEGSTSVPSQDGVTMKFFKAKR